MSGEQIVMIDEPGLVREVTVKMWVTKSGEGPRGDHPSGVMLYPTEQSARYGACTHRPCLACGAPAHKHYAKCKDCREMQAEQRFLEQPAAEWTEGPLFSHEHNRYFDDPDDAADYAAGFSEDGVTLENMRLELCKQTYPRMLTPDYFDEVPNEDFNGNEIPFPGKLQAAIDTFNAAVAGVCCGWEPSGIRLDHLKWVGP